MFKPLIASLAATLIASPASAAWLNQHGVTIIDQYDLPASHQPLFRALKLANVPIVDGHDWDQCEVTDTSYIGGFYIPSFDVIVLCTESPDPDQLGTLVHEAVHAAQDCRAGQENEIMSHRATQYMIDGLPQQQLDTIERFYPQDQWLDEVEARFLEQYPDHVADQLNTYCL